MKQQKGNFMSTTITLLEKLNRKKQLTKEEWIYLIENRDTKTAEYLFELARKLQKQHFGNRIYTRGLIEFTNYCKNNCLYCGIRRDNREADRYRLTLEQILECCRTGYELGFRTFVLHSKQPAVTSNGSAAPPIPHGECNTTPITTLTIPQNHAIL